MGPPRRGGPRAGGRKGDNYRIGGVDIAWDPDVEIDNARPTPCFPQYAVEKPRDLSEKEHQQINHFRSLRESIRKGPLYAVLSDYARVNKPGTTAAATFDTFNGMTKYSQRYLPKKRAIPRLDTRTYVFRFFPDELWSTLDPSRREVEAEGTFGSRNKPQNLSSNDKLNGVGLEEPDGSDDEDHGLNRQNMDEDDEAMMEEDLDDEYEDEDEGGDYNAEQYFDDGRDEGGDDLDGGDEAGMDYI